QKFDSDSDEIPVQMVATLADGLKFPRTTTDRQDSALQGGMKTYQFGPLPLQSPLKENTKFMNIRRLQYLRLHPEESRRMQDSLANLVRDDQETTFLQSIIARLKSIGVAQFKTVEGDQYSLIPASVDPTIEKNKL